MCILSVQPIKVDIGKIAINLASKKVISFLLHSEATGSGRTAALTPARDEPFESPFPFPFPSPTGMKSNRPFRIQKCQLQNGGEATFSPSVEAGRGGPPELKAASRACCAANSAAAASSPSRSPQHSTALEHGRATWAGTAWLGRTTWGSLCKYIYISFVFVPSTTTTKTHFPFTHLLPTYGDAFYGLQKRRPLQYTSWLVAMANCVWL
jgi:hypothetical protein